MRPVGSRPHPKVSRVFDHLFRHKHTSENCERRRGGLVVQVTVQVMPTRAMRERRNIQRDLYLIESNLNRAWIYQRFGETTNGCVVEERR